MNTFDTPPREPSGLSGLYLENHNWPSTTDARNRELFRKEHAQPYGQSDYSYQITIFQSSYCVWLPEPRVCEAAFTRKQDSQEIFKLNLGLVQEVIREFLQNSTFEVDCRTWKNVTDEPADYSADDLFQVGAEGLWHAIHTFRFGSRVNRFKRYGKTFIRNYLIKYIKSEKTQREIIDGTKSETLQKIAARYEGEDGRYQHSLQVLTDFVIASGISSMSSEPVVENPLSIDELSILEAYFDTEGNWNKTGKSHGSIAEELGFSENDVRRILASARQKMRGVIENSTLSDS